MEGAGEVSGFEIDSFSLVTLLPKTAPLEES